jgi:dUTP pyrophosphatase
MDSKSSAFKRIKEITKTQQETTSLGDDPSIYDQLGLDKNLLDELEKQSYEAAKEDVKVVVRYQNNSSNPPLSYKYVDDSGIDLRANLDSPAKLPPMGRMLVPTGLHFELPESYEIQVRPRSGLAAKKGITVLNTPGTVDRGYSGEIKVILINLGEENFFINHGDRIAQAVISPVISGRWSKLICVDSLKETQRSSGGFGSTGIK